METILVERDLARPATVDEVLAMEDRLEWCFNTYRIERVRSYLSADGRTLVCVFRAPDVESVKRASTKMAVPPRRIYRASVHVAE